jgi:hypothetical protein
LSWVFAGCGAQVRHGHVGGEVPVGVEPVGCAVEEGESGEVRRAVGVGGDVVVHGPSQQVGREQVHPVVADDRWCGGDGVE